MMQFRGEGASKNNSPPPLPYKKLNSPLLNEAQKGDHVKDGAF